MKKVSTSTNLKMEQFKAYTVDAEPDAHYPEVNHTAVVPEILSRKKFDLVVLQGGSIEITNLNTKANPQEHYKHWEQKVSMSSNRMFSLAQWVVEAFPGTRVIILTRLPRYDPVNKDPQGIKSKLSEYGNSVYHQLWVTSGCPKNIMIHDQGLGCNGALRIKRFGDPHLRNYDGIHMRGELAVQHYTNSVIRMFHSLIPSTRDRDTRVKQQSGHNQEKPRDTFWSAVRSWQRQRQSKRRIPGDQRRHNTDQSNHSQQQQQGWSAGTHSGAWASQPTSTTFHQQASPAHPQYPAQRPYSQVVSGGGRTGHQYSGNMFNVFHDQNQGNWRRGGLPPRH